MTTGLLPPDRWAAVVRDAPLVSIDLIVSDTQGRVLLGHRINRPAQGYWFVPGGVIRKGERLDAAFERLTLDELGIELPRSAARFAGLYEHHYPDNFSGSDFPTHYVVLAHRLQWPAQGANIQLPKAQHTRYQWMSVDELLAHPQVHRHVKDYFSDVQIG